MKSLIKVDSRVDTIGIDGIKILIPKFVGGTQYIYTALNGRKRMDKISIPYDKDKNSCFSLSFKDDSQGYGLLIECSFPKFKEFHNLYFTKIEETKEILNIIRKKLKDLGFITKIKKYETLDIEFGFNVVDSDISYEQKTLFRYVASGINPKYKAFSTSNTAPYMSEEHNIEELKGFSALKGYKRFKIYCKTSEMFEKIKAKIDKNITRVEVMISAHELKSKLGTRNLMTTIKYVSYIFKEKMEEAFIKIDKTNEKFKKYLEKSIREFRATGKRGLIKYILKLNYLNEEDTIEVIKKMNKELNYHGAEYIQRIKANKKGKIDKFVEIKSKLSLFFHSIASFIECIEEGSKLVLAFINKSLKQVIETTEGNKNKRRVKSVENLLKPSLE